MAVARASVVQIRQVLALALCMLAMGARLGAATLDVCQSTTISSNTLANPTVVTTTTPHFLASGETVTISGSNSTPTINGSRVVTVISGTTFSVPVNVTVAGTAGTVACGTHATLQSAITAAASGDTITLRAGATHTGNFTLPNKSNASVITIKSNAAGGSLPGSSTRTSPAFAAFLPKIQASAGGSPAFQFQAGATKYTVENLEFLGNPGGFGTIVNVGFGDSQQTLASQEPNNIILDRLYIHADPVMGQKNAITLAANTVTIKNSYISEIQGIGQDSQCIAGYNGTGQYTITNNFLSCAGENILFGGSDPWERVYLTVTGSSTPTGAAVAIVEAGHTLAELANAQLVAIQTPSGVVEFATLTAQPGSGTTGTLAWTPAVSVAPAVNGLIRGGVVAKTISITGNHLTKKQSWSTEGVVPRPTGLSVTPSTASGALTAGTRFYRVQAFSTAGYNNGTVKSDVSAEVRCDLSATGKCDLAWTDIVGETSYRAWCFATTGATSGTFIDLAAGTTSYSDTGLLTLTGAYGAGSRPQEKNLFELKAAQAVTFSGNVLEYQWRGSDIGYSIWLKSTNQDGACWWCQTRDVTIEKNLFRHIDGWLLVSAREAYSGNARPPSLTAVTVRHNLVYDSNATWAEGAGAPYAMKFGDGSVDLTVEHNTVVHQGSGLFQIYGNVDGRPHLGFIFRNNMVRKETFGIMGSGTGEGKATLDVEAPSYVFTKNAIAGAAPGSYPTGNFFPTVAAWESEFLSYSADGTNADYHLKPTSTYHNAATDGTDIGADIDQVNTAITGVIQGVSTSPPVITTLSLPNALRTVAYPSTTVLATGGATPYTWSVNAGSTLPTGLSFSGGGVLSGTPTASAGNYTFTLKVTDNGAQIATQTYTITISNATDITTTTLTDAEKDVTYSATLAATGDAAPYTWAVSAGSLPTGITLSSAGVLSGPPTANGTFNFTAQATGSLGSVDTQALSLIVSNESLPCGRQIAINGTQARIFRRKTAPTAAEPDCAAKGDIWIDTSVTPAIIKIATTATPTWALSSGSTGLAGDASALTNLNASELKVGTIPAAAFPNVLPGAVSFGASVTTPLLKGDYLEVALGSCATLSSMGTARLCADAATNQVKLSVNGGPYQSVSSSAGALIQNGNAFNAPLRIGTTDAQPLTFIANGVDHGTLWLSGNWYFDPGNQAGMKFMLELDRTTDFFSQGFTTANGRKAYLYSDLGTLRQYFGFSDTNTSTDPFFCFSASSDSGGTKTHAICGRQDGNLTFGAKVASYNGTTTAGGGMPIVVANGRSTAQTAAVASVAAFTVGAADATFEVSANVLVTTATTHAFTVTCTYTDEGNTSRTLTMPFTLVAGSAIVTSVANANGAVPYMGFQQTIRAKTGTTITIATTGTFTSTVYNVEAVIKKIS